MSDDISVLGIAVEQRGVKEGAAALDHLATAGKKAEQSTNSLTDATKRTSSVMSDLAKKAAGLFAGYQIAGLAADFIKTADSMSLMNARLKLVTSSQSEFAAVQSGILALSKENRAGISEMATLYTKLAPAIKAAGGGMGETMTIVDSFSKSLKLGGASAQESAASILQFAQAMGSGKLSGDEFRSLAEASPRFMRAVADSIGVPIGALKEMSAQGELTADVIGNALIKANATLTSEFKSLPGTVGDALEQVRNEFKLAVQDIDGASSATGGLASSISELAASIRPIGSIFAEAAKGMKGTGEQSDVLNASLLAVKTTFETLMVVGANVGYVFSATGREIGGIAAQMAALANLDFDGFSAIGDAMKEDAEAARKAIDEYSANILGAYEKAKSKPAASLVTQPAATGLKAPSSVAAYLADTTNAPKAAKIAAAVEKENKAFQSAINDLVKTDKDYETTLQKITAAHNERIAEITKEPKGSGGGSDGIANATLSFDLARIKRESDQLAAIYAGSEKIVDAAHAAGLIGDREYYAAKAEYINANAQNEEAALQAEIDRLMQEKATGKDRIENARKIMEAQAAISKIRQDADTANTINGMREVQAISKVAEAYAAAQASAQSYLDTVRRQNQRTLDGMGMGAEYRADQSAKNQIEDKFISRRASLDEGLSRGQLSQEDYNNYLALAKSTYDEEIRLHSESRDAILAKQADWTVGAAEALNIYADTARNVAQQTQKLFTNALQAGEDAFVQFAKTGKLSFSDLADSIIEDLARMAYKSAMTPITQMAGDWISKSLSGFSSGGTDYTMLGTGYVSGMRAGGGGVNAGETYVVGEKGPELLTMGGNGYITPNHALGGAMQVDVHNYGSNKVSVEQATDSRGQPSLQVYIAEAVADDMGRGGSRTNTAIRRQFGARPALVGR